MRWQTYFDSLSQQLRTGSAAKPVDWFALGEHWNRDTKTYPTEPQGDARKVAADIARELEYE